jgi:hypothetical protein
VVLERDPNQAVLKEAVAIVRNRSSVESFPLPGGSDRRLFSHRPRSLPDIIVSLEY